MHGKLWDWIPLNEFDGADKRGKVEEWERKEGKGTVCAVFFPIKIRPEFLTGCFSSLETLGCLNGKVRSYLI